MKSSMTAGKILPGIPFAHPEETAELLLDLYLPAGSQDFGPSPAVVHYHGGGWRTGCRSSLGPSVDTLGLSAIERLVEAGFVVASADYRLNSMAHFPAQLLDAKAAVRWLRAHAADYNVDPERIYAWGDSAGGHLASLVALTAGSANYRGDENEYAEFSDTVAAVAAWHPPTDLLRMGEQALPDAGGGAGSRGDRRRTFAY
jgi:acetyl esterase/lipase